MLNTAVFWGFFSNNPLSGPHSTEDLCSSAFKAIFIHYELIAQHPHYLSPDSDHSKTHVPSEEKALSYHEKQPWVIRCFVTMSETTEMFHSALIAI